jgi:threonine/homoserine/homoserine lactone efflux protein
MTAPAGLAPAPPVGTRRALREGVLVEAMNPKTAAFFLAFVPQFVDPAAGPVALQFAVLGMISVVLNTLADVVVAYAAGGVRTSVARQPGLVRRLREASGAAIVALGLGLLFARRPAAG